MNIRKSVMILGFLFAAFFLSHSALSTSASDHLDSLIKNARPIDNTGKTALTGNSPTNIKKTLAIRKIKGIAPVSSNEEKAFDVIIKGTKIVDGTGKPAFKGDVAIKGERIVGIGKIRGNAALVINGAGLVTCPGFIDPHSHADSEIEKYPLAENLIMQGITTFVGGNCAISPAPLIDLTFGQWLSNVEKKGISLNYVPLVGHNPIREIVMGNDIRRKATLAEIKEMKELVDEAMKSGAFGFSSFGDPSPSHFADIEELIELAKVAAKYNGIYATHTRHLQDQWPTDDPELVAYDLYFGPPEDVWVGAYRGYIEAMEISRRAKIPVEISHLGWAYRIPQPHPDFLEEALAKATLWMIDQGKREGVDVTFDVIATADSISKQLNIIDAFYVKRVGGLNWVQQFSREEFASRLKTREFRDRIRKVHDAGRLKFYMVHTKADPFWFDCFRILRCKNKSYEGKTIGEISSQKNADPLETVFDILVEDPKATWVQFLDKRDTDLINSVFLKHSLALASTDIGIVPIKIENPEDWPSPPSYGLYPNYIGHYIRDMGIFSLEEGIKKATFAVAQRFGIKERGILSSGAYADIVVFDFNRINQKGDFLNPIQRPEGIEYVLVNGKLVYKDMKHTGEIPGKVLRHK